MEDRTIRIGKIIIGVIVIGIIIFFSHYLSNVLNYLPFIDYYTLIFSLSLVIATILYWDTSRKNMWHQVLLNVQKDYRTAEMGHAIHTLWEFFRDECKENKDILKSKYEKVYNRELIEIAYKKPEEKIQYKKGTFDYQRRIVSQFYCHLNDLYKHRLLPKKIVLSYWEWKDLKIIEYILIPLNEKLNEIIEQKETITYESHRIQDRNFSKLYNDSIDFYNKSIDR